MTAVLPAYDTNKEAHQRKRVTTKSGEAHHEIQEEVSNVIRALQAMKDEVAANGGMSTAERDGSVGLGKESRQR